ncbi:MAG: prepilin-type N-terminal cleavage/methylation domain-containing protein [Patescibacteria group bacterium]|jgi:prepilin-type N-terminal cleavage/methylation domain-containing protein
MVRVNYKGVTLIEIVVSIAIFTLISGAAVELFIFMFPRKGDVITEQLSTQSETRKVLDDFVNEIRGATYSSIGSYPIAEASSTEIIFFSNPGAKATRDRVRYFLDGTLLKKGTIEPSGNPLVYDVGTEVITEMLHSVVPTTTIFTYYDAAYTGSESPLVQPVELGNIKMVGIKVTIDKNPLNSPNSFTTESKAVIRNLKDN